ncbi:MAG: COX15/CtaA family protein [Sandaracinaceae bacterium]
MLRRYAWTVLGANVLVILWGAVVRATGSGAGCGADWPDCRGELVHLPATVETTIELAHRLTSGVALLLVLGLLVAVLRSRERGHPARAPAIASMVLILVEAALGAGVVVLELVADNASGARAAWVGLHLANTFLLLGALTLTALWADGAPGPVRRLGGFDGGLLVAVLAGMLLVGASGAVTALGDTLFPVESLAEGIRQDLSASAHFLVRLRVIHPVLAVVVGQAALVLAVRGARGAPSSVRGAASGVVLLVLTQVAAGFLNLALLAPVWMQVVHLLLADLLWVGLVILGAGLLTAPRAAAPEGALRPVQT